MGGIGKSVNCCWCIYSWEEKSIKQGKHAMFEVMRSEMDWNMQQVPIHKVILMMPQLFDRKPLVKVAM